MKGAARPALFRLIDGLCILSCWAAGAVLAGIVGFYTVEIIKRYFFNAPTVWSSEAIAYMFCAVLFLGLPEVARQHRHIAITFVTDAAPHAIRRILNVATVILSSVVCLTVAWISLSENMRQFQNDIQTLSVVPIPKWWISSFITYGFALTGLTILSAAFDPSPAKEESD